jgi:hypothetical protein
MGRVDVDHMASHEPVEQHADRGQVRLTVGGETSA